MTLQEWAEKTGEHIIKLPVGSTGVMNNPNDPQWKELWHLSDYVVSSVCAGVVWLLKKR